MQDLVFATSLIPLADLLIHRVVLQNQRVSARSTRIRPMFHVKHFCVKSRRLRFSTGAQITPNRPQPRRLRPQAGREGVGQGRGGIGEPRRRQIEPAVQKRYALP